MSEEYDITGGLDLLGDWLDAKGYTEEAGLCTRAMDFIHKQGEENEKLRAALKPFAGKADGLEKYDDKDRLHIPFLMSELRAIANIFKEKEEMTVEKLRAENDKLRTALKPFADAMTDTTNWWYEVNVDNFRAAAAALKETGDE